MKQYSQQQLIEDIDKSATAQNDFAEIFDLRDTSVEKFDKIKPYKKIFAIFLLINNKVKRS